jgi:aspartate/methionine/tyrosine aminotransferase
LLACFSCLVDPWTLLIAEQVFALPAADGGGDPQLRGALAAFLNDYFHPVHRVKSEHVVLTAGASDSIESLVTAICDNGDSVLVPGVGATSG